MYMGERGEGKGCAKRSQANPFACAAHSTNRARGREVTDMQASASMHTWCGRVDGVMKYVHIYGREIVMDIPFHQNHRAQLMLKISRAMPMRDTGIAKRERVA